MAADDPLAQAVARETPDASPSDALAFLASLIEGHYAADAGEFSIAREIQPRAARVMRDVLARNAELLAALHAAREDAVKALDAFERYGEHESRCTILDPRPDEMIRAHQWHPCSCGLNATMQTLLAARAANQEG